MPVLDMFCMKDAGEWLGQILAGQESGKGISILEITERVQDPHASGSSIRPSSPRTVEAFLQSGVDPEDLVYKPVDYFAKRCGGNEELAREAFNFFDSQRLKRIEDLRTRRQALIDEGWKPDQATAAVAGKSTGAVGDTEDMVEKERKRLEVLRKRQEQDLQQLVDYELKRAQIQAKAEEKLAKQEARSLKQLEQKAAKEEAWRALQREQELKRLAEEQEDERKAKEMEKIRFRKEQDFLASEKIREKEMRKEAYRKEQERIQKAEQARMETEAILERQLKEVEARKREMQRRDEERLQAQQAKAAQLAEENEEKRIKADARLKAAFDANIQILERRRQEFYQREKEALERRKKQDEERAAADEMKRKMLSEKAEKRKEVFNMAQKRLDDRIKSILVKSAEQEESMRKEMERREKALARKKLFRQLNMEYRMECVDTNRKQQLYQREQLLQRIQAETDRIMRMQRDRSKLQLQRKEANMQASMARQAMVENMDRLQQAKQFDKIATGEITLESLMK